MPATRIAKYLYIAGALAFGIEGNYKVEADDLPRAEFTTQGATESNYRSCGIPAGWREVEIRKPDFGVFGELHGTEQGPEFVGDLACAIATSGQRILLGVELDSSLNPQLQRSWELPQAEFAQALSMAGWAGRRDGVASEAMFGLLVRLHELKSTGSAISIVAFNGQKDAGQRAKFSALLGQNPHETAQAENIMLAAQSGKYDLTLVLVGNLHAKLQSIELSGVSVEPMAMRLARTNTVVSLNMHHDGGAAWNCKLKAGFVPQAGQPITDDAIACGNHEVKAYPASESRPARTVHIDSNKLPDRIYDGFYAVGIVAGSPPAF